jgi:hypothetical protein
MSAILSILGLVANLAGVLLLFRYGMPYRVPSASGMFLMNTQRDPEIMKEDAKYTQLGKIGLWLVIVGTFLQVLGVV